MAVLELFNVSNFNKVQARLGFEDFLLVEVLVGLSYFLVSNMFCTVDF